jgi:hypothetical protein
MSTKQRASVFVALLVITFSVISNWANAQVHIKGGRSCGVWIEDRRSKDKLGEIGDMNWLIGYLSGLTSAWNKDILAGTDNSSIYLWVDNYCQTNPMMRLDDAAEALARDLLQQKGL